MLPRSKKLLLIVIPVVAAASALTLYTTKPKEDVVIYSSVTTDNVGEEAAVETEETSKNVSKELSEKVTREIQKNEELKTQAQSQQQKAKSEEKKTENKAAAKTAGKASTYRNAKLGIELTFPADWENKYVVKEDAAGIMVYYKFQHNYYIDYYGNKYPRENQDLRYLFCIKDTSKLGQNELDVIDGIRNVPKRKTIHGKEYAIGGPTDCLGKNDPDRPEVDRLLNELPSVINNLREI